MQKKLSKSSTNNSVKKVFSIIEILVKYPNGCSLAHLVKASRLNKSTTYRFLKTLVSLGYVTNSLIEGHYRLTFKLAYIGEQLIHETNIVQLSILHLTRLRDITGATVNLKLFQEDHEVILYKLEPLVGNFRTRTYMGQRSEIYCSATGKVFFAYRKDEFLNNYWTKKNKSIKRLTNDTIVDKKKFIQNIALVRKNGFSIENGENELGISCLAAPVFDIYKEVNYAISISLQTAKITDNKVKQKYIKELIKASLDLSKELGYIK